MKAQRCVGLFILLLTAAHTTDYFRQPDYFWDKVKTELHALNTGYPSFHLCHAEVKRYMTVGSMFCCYGMPLVQGFLLPFCH